MKTLPPYGQPKFSNLTNNYQNQIVNIIVIEFHLTCLLNELYFVKTEVNSL